MKRVIRGLADTLGVPRGMVIAGFVLGFVFLGPWTVVVFLAAWYWVDHPERARRWMDAACESVRWTADRVWRGAAGAGHRGGGGAPDRGPDEPPPPPADPAALARRFERIERRARAIEEFVASEEFRLNREFRRMERD